MPNHRSDCRSASCPGCGTNSEVAQLKRRVAELEKDNRELREAVNSAISELRDYSDTHPVMRQLFDVLKEKV